MAIFRKKPVTSPKPIKCLCEDMVQCGIDMHNPIYKSAEYRGFTLHENCGWWRLEFEDNSIEIFYCPFCGRQLNNWNLMAERRRENFEKWVGR